MTNSESRTREILIWTFAAAVVRVLFSVLTPQVIDSADSILYLEAADRIATARFDEVYPRIPLLYPVVTAVVSFCTPNVEEAALLVSLLAMTALIPLLFKLSLRMHGLETARVTACMTILWPWLVDYACRAAPEALYAMLWFTTALCVTQTVRHGGIFTFLLPVCLVLLYLARPEGIVIVFAALASSVVLRGNSGAKLVRLAPSVLVLCVAIPVHIYAMQQLALHAGVSPRVSASSVTSVFGDWGLEILGTGAQLLFKTLPVMLGPVLLLLIWPGMRATNPQPRDRQVEKFLLMLAAAQFIAASLSTFAEPRYVMTTVVALSLWSARGATALSSRLAAGNVTRRFRHAPAAIVTVMMCGGLLLNLAPPMLGKMSYRPLEYKLAGRWMKDNLAPGLVLSRKPQVGYYAGMPTTGPAPTDSLDDIYARVIDASVRYVVVDERYSTDMIPALKPLLDPANAPAWLHVLCSDLSPYKEARIVVYEVVVDSPGL